MQSWLARQPVCCPSQGFEWLALSPTLPVTPTSGYNHGYTAHKARSQVLLFFVQHVLCNTNHIIPVHAALRQAASMLCLPLAQTVHRTSGLNFHFHANQPTQSPCTAFFFTVKVPLLQNSSCHMQANGLQSGISLVHIATQPCMHTNPGNFPPVPTLCHAELFQ